MKKSIIVAIFTLSFLFVLVPQKANSQSVFGLSSVGYNSTTREIFGSSATWLDFQLAWYYDPEVLGELYWQFNNEVPLDSGYGIGLSLPQYGVLIPAVVYLYSTSYLPVTLYTTYSTHFVRSYYVYDSCSGPFGFFAPCYSDPFGFSNFFGGFLGGPSFGWPGFPFNPFFFVSGRRYTLGTTQVSILTPPGPFCLPSFKSGEMMVTADGATAPACPTPTPTPTPTPITTILEVSPLVVTPTGTEGAGPGAPKTATVTVKTQPATPNRSVTLTLIPGVDSGGHVDAHHTGRRPTGQLRRTTGTTNASGQFTTTYTPPVIGGIVDIQATVAGGTPSARVGVQSRVTFLFELQAGTNYELIGTSASHPSNHWGTNAANFGLREIADNYKMTFYGQNAIPQADKLHYNDQSLLWGGKFELRNHWQNGGPHMEHRRGINCDVRCCTAPGIVPVARRAQLEQMFNNAGSTLTGDETNTNQPHWHLRFLFGGDNVAVNRNAGHFVTETFSSALEREADPDEWQERMDTFDAAHLQGQIQTIDAAKAMTSALFQSVEYINRNRSDQDFVTDLYQTFLLRDPDAGGYSNWLTTLQNGYGRDHVIRGFAESTEFRNLIIALTDTPALGPVCNQVEEQSCYNQGGIWDPDNCFCEIEPPPDPCLNKPWLCDIYPIY